MNTRENINARGRFDGVAQVVRFNRRSYISSVFVIAVSFLTLLTDLPVAMRTALCLAAAAALYWSIASLVASYWVYDHSPLYQWRWLPELLPFQPCAWANIHAGLDESSDALRRLFPSAEGRTVDIFDPVEMSEPSIASARGTTRPGDSTRVRADDLPFGDGELDTVFLLLAAHEIRRSSARAAFFGEIHRSLRGRGQIVLLEHLRDLSNFLAYGPGFTHFHSRRTWMKATASGFEVVLEKRLTPFLRVIIFRRST